MTLDISWPSLPEGADAWETFGLTQVWVLARMPDGSCLPGAGTTAVEAVADARRWWLRWKHAHPGRLAADGCDYQRRLANRRRRR